MSSKARRRPSKQELAETADSPVEQNLMLAKYVIDAAQREMAEKARKRVPALRMGAVAGVLGTMAVAASYRMNLALLERKLPPEAAALVATAVYSGGASAAALAAMRRWRGLPTPLPTETAKQVAEIIQEAAD
ncbi:phage holin family protein [Actinomadura kijaniata]|uniref:phage holin family protein n=1 Tax=Actinomadura kijaniata TaxID=46161 RepID=UPI000A06590D|nr:phage holin family protein [Actinomadura kijaniata]